MSPLRQQYIRLLTLRGYSQRTHESYIAAVAALGGHYGRSPIFSVGTVGESIAAYNPTHHGGVVGLLRSIFLLMY